VNNLEQIVNVLYATDTFHFPIEHLFTIQALASAMRPLIRASEISSAEGLYSSSTTPSFTSGSQNGGNGKGKQEPDNTENEETRGKKRSLTSTEQDRSDAGPEESGPPEAEMRDEADSRNGEQEERHMFDTTGENSTAGGKIKDEGDSAHAYATVKKSRHENAVG